MSTNSITREIAEEIIRKTKAKIAHPIFAVRLAADLSQEFLFHVHRVAIHARSRKQHMARARDIAKRVTSLDKDLHTFDKTYLAMAVAVVQSARGEYRDLVAPVDNLHIGGAISPWAALDISIRGVKLLAEWFTVAEEIGTRPRQMPPTVELIGRSLPLIYEHHFGLPFRIGTSGDTMRASPGMRFVQASLEAAAINHSGARYSVKTIRAYRQHVLRFYKRSTRNENQEAG